MIDNTSSCAERYSRLQAEIVDFAQQLAQLVVRDGEGATKFITIRLKMHYHTKTPSPLHQVLQTHPF